MQLRSNYDNVITHVRRFVKILPRELIGSSKDEYEGDMSFARCIRMRRANAA